MRTHMFNLSAAVLAAAAFAAPALAAPTMDGTADAEYGVAKSVQNTQTQFGNTLSGDLIDTTTGGSEIDQVFAIVSGDRLYVTVTGNLENNFNKLAIYLDTKAGGVHQLVGNQLPDQVDGYCCGGNAPGGNTAPCNAIADSRSIRDSTPTISWRSPTAMRPSETSFGPCPPTTPISRAAWPAAPSRPGIQLGPQGRPVVLRFPLTPTSTRTPTPTAPTF